MIETKGAQNRYQLCKRKLARSCLVVSVSALNSLIKPFPKKKTKQKQKQNKTNGFFNLYSPCHTRAILLSRLQQHQHTQTSSPQDLQRFTRRCNVTPLGVTYPVDGRVVNLNCVMTRRGANHPQTAIMSETCLRCT